MGCVSALTGPRFRRHDLCRQHLPDALAFWAADKKSPPLLEAGFFASELYAGSSMNESGGVGIGSDRL
jgi:hypothetical protein